MYTTAQLNTVNKCSQLDNWVQSITVHKRTTEYGQQLDTTGQLNTVNKCWQQDNWIGSTTGQLNTVNNCTQLDNWIQSTTVHNWITDYDQILDATGKLNTVNYCTQLNNQIQLASDPAEKVNTVIKRTQLKNWIQSTTMHNWITTNELNTLNKLMQYSQHWTVQNGTTEYSQ